MWQLVIWIGLQIISALLFRPKSNNQATMAPGEVSTTTVDTTGPVPVLFGTRLLTGANCVWYGDVGTTPIIKCGGGKK